MLRVSTSDIRLSSPFKAVFTGQQQVGIDAGKINLKLFARLHILRQVVIKVVAVNVVYDQRFGEIGKGVADTYRAYEVTVAGVIDQVF